MTSVLTWTALGVLIVGFGSGLLSGMFGVGGAVLTTPGIRALGATPLEAVGSTVPPIIPGAIMGAYRYARAGLVNWRIGLVCGVTGTVFAIAGAKGADLVDPHVLMLLTAGLLVFSGLNALAHARSGAAASDAEVAAELGLLGGDEPEPERVGVDHAAAVAVAARPRTVASAPAGTRTVVALPALVLVGAGAGFLAGLLGVGGGIVMMPAFRSILRVPLKEAAASSLVAVAIFSVPALAMHAALGHINWAYAGLLAAGAVPGARLGSHVTMHADERVVGRLFGIFLLVLATLSATAELRALFG